MDLALLDAAIIATAERPRSGAAVIFLMNAPYKRRRGQQGGALLAGKSLTKTGEANEPKLYSFRS